MTVFLPSAMPGDVGTLNLFLSPPGPPPPPNSAIGIASGANVLPAPASPFSFTSAVGVAKAVNNE